MKKINILLLSVFCFIGACNNPPNSENEQSEKELELLKKELELTKKELELNKKAEELNSEKQKIKETKKEEVKPIQKDFQSDPKLVVQEIFKAAKSMNFTNMSKLCDPQGESDGDTKQICQIGSAPQSAKEEFRNYFKDGIITGDVIYSQAPNGVNAAAVPFKFNHPQGEDRSYETMYLVERNRKWYIVSL